jgi:hypothetical protein
LARTIIRDERASTTTTTAARKREKKDAREWRLGASEFSRFEITLVDPPPRRSVPL